MTGSAVDVVPMSRRERIGHSLLFEVLALLILIPLGASLSPLDHSTMAGVAIAMSLIAMAVNYGYNLWFDRIFGEDRLGRSWKMRLAHGLGFETCLLTISLPLLMWVTGLDFLTVLILDIGMVIFFIIYAISYNYCYDRVRDHLLNNYLARQISN